MTWFLAAALAAPPTLLDLQQLEHVSGVRLHPDGRSVLFEHGGWTFDPAAEPFGDSSAGWTYHSEMAALDLTTRAVSTVQDVEGWSVTTHTDGRVAYVGRDGRGGAAIFVAAGEDVRQLDTGGTWPSDLAWDPSGQGLYFLTKSPRTEAEREAAWWAAGVREYDAPQRMVRLHRVDLSTGTVAALSPETVNVVSYALHPKGGPTALTTSPTERDYDAYFMASVQQLASDGTLTPISEPGCAYSPSYSPDGESLLWKGCNGGILVDALWAHRAGKTVDLLAGADLAVEGFEWTQRGLLIWTQDGLYTGLRELRKGKLTKVELPPMVLGASAVHPSGRWAIVEEESPAHRGRLARLDLRTGALETLYDPNPDWAEFDLPTTEVVRWTAADGTALEGLLHRPAAGVPVRGLLVNPHGGPNSVSTPSFGNGYHHAFTAAGYAVFQPNFRGGVGYGRAFYEANRGQIADLPFSDIESGVDHLVASGFDEGALFYGGWSYGAYLSAWTLGHTHRYRAIVAGGTISSRLIQYTMSSNTGRRAEFIFGGNPWTRREAFDRQDPNRFLADARTPTLLLHGRDDDATPLPHALILHKALKDLGVETELYIYPDERHGGFEPARVQHVMAQWIRWMDTH